MIFQGASGANPVRRRLRPERAAVGRAPRGDLPSTIPVSDGWETYAGAAPTIKIIEDRVLARVAFEPLAWGGNGNSAVLADVALGQAVMALRVLGIQAAPQVTRAVSEDIAAILADPVLLPRARIATPCAERRKPAGTSRLAA